MRLFSGFVLLILGIALLSACSSSPSVAVELAPVDSLPPVIQQAPEAVRLAYQFAAANPEALKNVPCFCGCQALGHTNNYDCYIQAAPTGGEIIFDEHALGCTICVDITQDVLRMTREGRAPAAIRRAIVNSYSQFGTSNQ